MSDRQTVYVVTGFDVGGNGGTEIMGIYTSRADADDYAVNSPDRKHNNAMWPWQGAAFDVEEHEIIPEGGEVNR